MIVTQPLAALEALRPQTTALSNPMLVQPQPPSFGEAFANALESVSGSLETADALSVSAANNPANIADAAIARARADVMLEVATVTAAKVSGAITQLLQTQL